MQSLPSLAICTNAARSCSHIAEISRLRKNGSPVPVLLVCIPAFAPPSDTHCNLNLVVSVRQRSDIAFECMEREAHGTASAHEQRNYGGAKVHGHHASLRNQVRLSSTCTFFT